MGGQSKKAGKGGGGGGAHHRNCNPDERKKLSKDPGVPGGDLRRVGESLLKTNNGYQRRIMNIPTLNSRVYNMNNGDGIRSMNAISQEKMSMNDDNTMIEAAVRDRLEEERRHQSISQLAALALSCAQRQAQHTSLVLPSDNGINPSAVSEMDDEDDRQQKDVSLRRFFKDFQKVVSSSDVLLEVLDARDPIGCRLLHLEKTIQSQWGDKKQVIMILNKADLVPTAIVEQWERYFSNQGVQVLSFMSCKDSGSQHERSTCIAKLFKMLRNIAKGESGARKFITVGVIGYPNVGKSSIINTLKHKTVVGVGNTPGFTTGHTEVELRNDVRILDCPGVVMPGEDTGDVVLRNAVKVDQLDQPMIAVERLVQRSDKAQLSAVYGVGSFNTAQEFVHMVGIRRGRIRQGGIVDEDETCRIILHNWNDGIIGYYTVPPATSKFLERVERRRRRNIRKKSLANSGEENEEMDDDDDVSSISDNDDIKVMNTAAAGVDMNILPTFHLIVNNTEYSNSKLLKKKHTGGKRTRDNGSHDDGFA